MIAQGLRPLFGIGKRHLDYSLLSKEAKIYAPSSVPGKPGNEQMMADEYRDKRYDRIKKSYEKNIAKHVSPRSAAIFLGIFWIFSLTILRISFITKLSFFAFFLSVIYLIYNYLKKRKQRKEGGQQ